MLRTDMPDITWQDPPPRRSSTKRYGVIRDALRQRPGEWALIRRGASSASAATMRRAVVWEGFEIRSVTTDNKTAGGTPRHDVYARFVGDIEEDSHATA